MCIRPLFVDSVTFTYQLQTVILIIVVMQDEIETHNQCEHIRVYNILLRDMHL